MSVYPGVCGGYGIPGPPGPPGPPGLDIGGRITVPDQLVPTTPAAISFVAGPGPLTGATVTANTFVPATTSMWEFTGVLDLSTQVGAPGYIIDVDCWLVWNDSFGVPISSEMATCSGRIQAGTNYRASITLTAAIPAGRAVTIIVQTFGRDTDASVRMIGGFAVARLLTEAPVPALLEMDGRPGGSNPGLIPIPSQGTDTFMIWSGDYRPEDTYKRGVSVVHKGAAWVARVDRPNGEPGLLGSEWDLVAEQTGGGGGGDDTGGVLEVLKSEVPDGSDVDLTLSLIDGSPVSGITVVNGAVRLNIPGLWILSGVIDVRGLTPTPANFTVGNWLTWTENGEPRETPTTERSADASETTGFTNRFHFTIFFEAGTEIKVRASNDQLDAIPASLSGELICALVFNKNAGQGDDTGGVLAYPSTTIFDADNAILPVTNIPGSPISGMTVVENGFRVNITGLWIISGVVTVTSTSLQPVSYTVSNWLEWEEGGTQRSTLPTGRSGNAGGGSQFTNRFHFTVFLDAGTVITNMMASDQLDGLSAVVSGEMVAALVLNKPEGDMGIMS